MVFREQEPTKTKACRAPSGSEVFEVGVQLAAVSLKLVRANIA
jgi:hypothetical protein